MREVLSAFAAETRDQKLCNGPENVFEAVGAVGKHRDSSDGEGYSIPNYFRDFSLDARRTNDSHHDLAGYFETAAGILEVSGNCGEAMEKLIAGVVHLLRLAEIREPLMGKFYSRYALIERLDSIASSLPFRRLLLSWCNVMAKGAFPTWDEFGDSLEKALSPGVALSTQRANVGCFLQRRPLLVFRNNRSKSKP